MTRGFPKQLAPVDQNRSNSNFSFCRPLVYFGAGTIQVQHKHYTHDPAAVQSVGISHVLCSTSCHDSGRNPVGWRVGRE